jgi:hypothetical protein
MSGEIAEYGAESAQAIGIDIWKVLATISIGGILCFFANGENHKYLKNKPFHLLQIYYHIALANSSLMETHRDWPNQHIDSSSYVQPSHFICSRCISI